MKLTTNNKLAALVLPVCAAFLFIGASTAHAGGFMKLGAIKGEATDNEHKDWIIIESMSAPIFRALVPDPTTGHMRRRGDVILEDLTCTKELDKSSPKIAESVCTGTFFDEVEIHFCVEVQVTEADGTVRNKQEPYLKYKLTNCIVSSYSFHGSAAGDPLPTEEVTLGYTEVEWTYIVLDPEGNPTETITGFCAPTPGT